MQLYQTPTNFTTINHNARLKLGLSWLEYGLADLIYNLSNNPKSEFPGWCYASKESLAKYLGTSKQTVHTILNKLEAKGLITRHETTRHLKITVDWYNLAIIKTSKETLPMVKKVYSNSKESLLPPSKESLHNIYITNNNNNKYTGIICPNKLEGHAGCLEFIESFAKSRKIELLNKGRQIYALHKILEAGITFDDLNKKIDVMEADYFWRRKGFDLMNVLNEYGKGGEYGK